MAFWLCSVILSTLVTLVVGESEHIRTNRHSMKMMQVRAGQNAFASGNIQLLLIAAVILLFASLFVGTLWWLNRGSNHDPGSDSDTGTRTWGRCFGSENLSILPHTGKTLKDFAVRLAFEAWSILIKLIIGVIIFFSSVIFLEWFLYYSYDHDASSGARPTENASESILPSQSDSRIVWEDGL